MLPVTGDILRGSLLQRTIRNHAKGCAKCASGEGHQVAVLTVSYPGGRTRQFSLRREQVGEVRRWLGNYQKLKAALEAICELNHELLRPDAARRGAGGSAMIEMRRAQRSFGDGLIAAEVGDLREPWMAHADPVLADEELVATVYEALAKRHPNSRSRGRKATPAEMVLRLLILKHVRNWSYEALEREVRANLVYRDFTRVGGAKMPDAKTMGRWGVRCRAAGDRADSQRMVTIAKDKGVAKGRNMRIDTTVVETNIHYPTDFSLLGDGVRVSDPHHEEDHRDCRRRRHQTARPQPQREAAGVGHCPGGALQGQAGSGETQPRLRPVAQFDEPRGRTGQALRRRDCRGRERRDRRPQATGAGRACARRSRRWCRWSAR